MKRFQLLGTAEEMTSVEATFMERNNDRMKVGNVRPGAPTQRQRPPDVSP